MTPDGLIRARVEVNIDPKGLGRVRVRIPALHGDPSEKDSIPSADLPWAFPCMPFFIGSNVGSCIVPPRGSWIWVMREYGTDEYVYFGGIPSLSDNIAQAPNEAKSNNKIDSNKGVIFKSKKGHVLYYDDTSGSEVFSIVDAAGQQIKMLCPNLSESEAKIEILSGKTTKCVISVDKSSISLKSLSDVHAEVSVADGFVQCKVDEASTKMTKEDITHSVGNSYIRITQNRIEGRALDIDFRET